MTKTEAQKWGSGFGGRDETRLAMEGKRKEGELHGFFFQPMVFPLMSRRKLRSDSWLYVEMAKRWHYHCK